MHLRSSIYNKFISPCSSRCIKTMHHLFQITIKAHSSLAVMVKVETLTSRWDLSSRRCSISCLICFSCRMILILIIIQWQGAKDDLQLYMYYAPDLNILILFVITTNECLLFSIIIIIGDTQTPRWVGFSIIKLLLMLPFTERTQETNEKGFFQGILTKR